MATHSSGRRSGYVYLSQWWNYYKIGMSINPEKRIASFNVTMPIPQKLIHKIKVEDMYKAEAYLHYLFAEKRVKHEWFLLTPQDVQMIKRKRTISLKVCGEFHRDCNRKHKNHLHRSLRTQPNRESQCSIKIF